MMLQKEKNNHKSACHMNTNEKILNKIIANVIISKKKKRELYNIFTVIFMPGIYD